MDDEEEDDDEEADDGIYHHSFEFAERPEECELMIRIGNIEHQKGIDMQRVLEWAYAEGKRCGWVEPIETVHLCLRLRGGGGTKDRK